MVNHINRQIVHKIAESVLTFKPLTKIRYLYVGNALMVIFFFMKMQLLRFAYNGIKFII